MRIPAYRIRHIVLGVSIFGMMWFALYSNYTITRLQRSASIATSTYASLISNSIRYNISYEKYDVERIIQDFDIPLIITDTSWQPITWTNIMKPGFFRKKRFFLMILFQKIFSMFIKKFMNLKRNMKLEIFTVGKLN